MNAFGGGGFGGGNAGRRDDNIFDLSKRFTQSSSSGYFSVEPFLQSLAANPSLGKSTRSMNPFELAQANQFMNTVNAGGAGNATAAGLDLSAFGFGKKASAQADDADVAAADDADTQNQAAEKTDDVAKAGATDEAAETKDTDEAADADEPKTEAKLPDTPLTRLMKGMASADSEIKITRGDLTKALAMGDSVDNPDEELTLSKQDAMMLLQGSPLKQMMSGGMQVQGGADPLSSLAALAGGASGSNPLAALMGGASSGGSSLQALAAAMTGGGASNPLASLLGGAGNANALAALASSMTAGGTKAAPSLADIFDIPTLGKADSITKLANLGKSEEA